MIRITEQRRTEKRPKSDTHNPAARINLSPRCMLCSVLTDRRIVKLPYALKSNLTPFKFTFLTSITTLHLTMLLDLLFGFALK